MVHCVIRCRQVDKSGSYDPSFLVAIFNVRCSSIVGAVLFMIKHSYSMYMKGYWSVAESFPGFNRVMISDFFHIVGTCF